MNKKSLGRFNMTFIADPLFYLLHRFSLRPGLTAFLSSFVMGIWYLACGIITKNVFRGQDYLDIFDPRELSFGLFIWLVWIPVILFYYLWQPEAVLKLVTSLQENGIFRSKVLVANLNSEIRKVFGNPVLSAIAFPISISITLIEILIVAPQESIAQGKPSFWFIHWSVTLAFCIAFLIFVYMLIVFVLRNVILAWKVNQFFRKYKDALYLQVFHPDRCGGLLFLGKFSLRIGLLAVMTGLFAVFLGIRPVFWGGKAVMNIGTVAMYSAYVVLLPLSIMPYIWSTHKAMLHFKQKQLLVISKRIDAMIGEAKKWNNVQSIEKGFKANPMSALVDQYDILQKRIPVWPISLPHLRSFGLTALLPLLPGFFQVAIDVGQKFGWY